MLLNLIYLVTIAVASPWIAYRAMAQGRYRRGIRQKFFGLSKTDVTSSTSPTAWFHAVSVGEVNLLPGLITAFKKRNPHWHVVVSCSTDTGFDLAIQRLEILGTPVFFCPLDFTWAVKRTLKTLQPKLLVLVELELWPNLVRLASQSGCPCAVVNARLSEKSASSYLRVARVIRSTFARLAWVGCQDHDYAARFIACGTPQSAITVTGSLKFDDAPTTRETIEVQSRLNWSGASPWHQVLLAGSTHEGEEQIAIEAYRQLIGSYPDLRLILTPRHSTRFNEVQALIESMGFQCRRRSTSTTESSNWDSNTVLLIDTIGELRHWWGTARIAFVGGGFGDRGGQNMLEPAGYGCAVCFGPNTKNFEEIASRLIVADGAVRLQEAQDLVSFAKRCLDEPPAADQLGINAQAVVQSHRGATDRTIDHLSELASVHDYKPYVSRAA